MDADRINAVTTEIERRWRERTPATTINHVCPENRVDRHEIYAWAEKQGIVIPLRDDDYDRAVFQLFDRLRKAFPNEKWEPRRNWTAATKERRKELGLR